MISAIRLNSTISTAKIKASVCTIGMSLAWIAPISAAPMPFTPNRFSVMIAPPKIDGMPSAMTVTTGISDATHVAVLSGLKTGQQVVTGPIRTLKKLKDGDAVEVTKEESKKTEAE